MIEGASKLKPTPSEVSDFSFGKSIPYFISLQPLRMINVLESLRLNQNAFQPSRMEVNSGKSIHHSPPDGLTLKYSTIATKECISTKH